MKFSNKLFFVILVLFSIQVLQAQHIDIDKKLLSFLAVEKTINILFTYDGLKFNEDNEPEEGYLEDITLGEKKRYYKSKDSIWPIKFTTTLNSKLKEYKNGPQFNIKDSTANYTMRVNNSWMYFGYNVIAAKWPAKAKLDLTFYETSNPETIIYETTIDKALGTNNEVYNLDKWSKFNRVAKAYEKGAYKLAQAFKRIVN